MNLDSHEERENNSFRTYGEKENCTSNFGIDVMLNPGGHFNLIYGRLRDIWLKEGESNKVIDISKVSEVVFGYSKVEDKEIIIQYGFHKNFYIRNIIKLTPENFAPATKN